MRRTIGIGEANSFRYIGVKSALDPDISRQLLGELAIPRQFSPWNRFHDMRIGNIWHTEFSLEVGRALEELGPQKVDLETISVAYQISELLGQLGDQVRVLPEVVPVDSDVSLFGAEANEIRFIIRHLDETSR